MLACARRWVEVVTREGRDHVAPPSSLVLSRMTRFPVAGIAVQARKRRSVRGSTTIVGRSSAVDGVVPVRSGGAESGAVPSGATDRHAPDGPERRATTTNTRTGLTPPGHGLATRKE